MGAEQPRRGRKPGSLDRASWIEAANELLIRYGIDAVKVEPLAASLSVTKGSFYWHFKDRAALLDAILDDWRRRLTLAIIDSLEASGKSPADRLHALLALRERNRGSERDSRIELAIRLWARSDARALAVMREADALRLDYFTHIFAAIGHSPDDARAKAVLAYSYMRVAASLLYAPDDAERRNIEKILLGSS